MPHRDLMRIIAVAVLASASAPSLAAQEAAAPADTGSSSHPQGTLPHKSVALASLLGLALPGAGHWYAGETRRGGVIASIFLTSGAILGIADPAKLHEWNGVERAVGWMWLGTLAFGCVDGTLAAQRYNLRPSISVGSGADASKRTIQVGLSLMR